MPDADGNPDEEKPRWFSEFIPLNNLDSDLANSTKRYYALDPNEEEKGDWAELVGRPVNITIITKGEYNNIGGTAAMRPKDAAKLPELVNPSRVFSMDDPNVEVFLSLPNFVQDKIKEGLEFEGSKLDELLQKHSGKPVDKKTKREVVKDKEGTDDSIPFEPEPLVEGTNDDGDW